MHSTLRAVVKVLSGWWKTIAAAALTITVGVLTVVSANGAKPRTISLYYLPENFPRTEIWRAWHKQLGSTSGGEPILLQHITSEIAAARKETMERSSHFEELLVAIGSIQLGIMAFMGTMLLGRDFKAPRPKPLFALAMILVSMTAFAYLHTFNIYMAY